jgi:hypothetical protein
VIAEKFKLALDWASIATALAALAAWLPPLAALASLVWTGIRIYETKTVQGWIERWKQRRQARSDLEASDYKRDTTDEYL